jgi:DNA-dependent metalloprotease WSS1
MNTRLIPLKKQKNPQEAHSLLKRLISHVQNIMKKRKWNVGCLYEFYPQNPNLLGININRGKVIKIRLRNSQNPDLFLEFHDLIGTMLHELVHIEHGPHDIKFYRLLDEIYSEYENDLDNGFKPDGDKLGGIIRTKQEQLKLIEKRVWLNGLMHVGGRKLGGFKSTKNIKELVAEAAVKRIQDSKWCSTNSGNIEEITKETPNCMPKEDTEAILVDQVQILGKKRKADESVYKEWECKDCEFINHSLSCKICKTPRDGIVIINID